MKFISLAAAAMLLPCAALAFTLPTSNIACLTPDQQEEIKARTEEIALDVQRRKAKLPAIGPGFRVDELRRTRDDLAADLAKCLETARQRKRGPEFCEKESVQAKVAEKRFEEMATGTSSAVALDLEQERRFGELRARFPACTGALSAQDDTAAGTAPLQK